MDKRQSKLLWPLGLGIIALMGLGLVWASTIWGAGLISDTYQYVSTARNLASGSGFQYAVGKSLLPLVHYPPLFPIVLAAFEFAGIDALFGARLVNAVLFGVNAVLVGVSIEKIVGSKIWGSLGALLTTLAAVLLGVHSWALSEPLYIFLGLVAWLLLSWYLQGGGRSWLVWASIVLGLAFMTRYAGVGIVAAGVLGVLLFSSKDWRKRITDAILLGGISVILPGLWALRIALLSGDFGARELQYIPLTGGNLISLLNNVLTWIVPAEIVNGREILVIVGLLVGIAGFVWFLKQSGLEPKEIGWPQHTLYRLHSLYFLIYPTAVIAAKIFLDRGIGLNDRMLSPMLVSLIIIGVSLVARVWEADKRLWVRIGIGCGVILFGAFSGFETARAMRSYRSEGLGLARAGWYEAESIQLFAGFEDKELFSNSPSTLYLWSAKPANNLNAFGKMVESISPVDAYVVLFLHAPINKDVTEMAEGVELVAADDVAEVYLFTPEGE